jgi:peroxiredoxin
LAGSRHHVRIWRSVLQPTTNRRSPLRFLEPVLWVLVLGFVGVRLWPQAAAMVGVGSAGAAAPEVQVTTLDGQQFALSELRGQVVLVNFWATWCPPCRVEMPGFQRVYEETRERGFTIVGLSTDRGARGTVERFLEERGLTFPVALASAEAIRGFGEPRALPTSFLIDHEGRIRYTVKGIFAEPALRRAVSRLLDERDAAAASP